jgi:chalcone isomerase-like protein
MTRISVAVSFVALLSVASANAATLAGVELPDTITVDGSTLVLNGIGLREATALRVKVYVGGLYLEQRSSDPTTVIDSRQPKVVTMKFLRDIDRGRLASGWADSLRKVGGKKLEPAIAQFTSMIGDVKKDDTMSFTSRPGAGVEVSLRGQSRGTVPGDEFSHALFTVWFGPNPGDANLKRGMLGK